jgi:hypothetical protein
MSVPESEWHIRTVTHRMAALKIRRTMALGASTNRLPAVGGRGGVVDVCPLSVMDHGIRHNNIVQFPVRERSV